jgi:hypothetical protein
MLSGGAHKKIRTVLYEEIEMSSSYFMQDSATVNMANFLMIALEGLFSKQVITCGLRVPVFSDVKHCNYSLCKRLKAFYVKTPCHM